MTARSALSVISNADPAQASRQLTQAAERSARAAENITALGEMTRGITHDFRNVLCMLTSGLSIAESNVDDRAKLAVAFRAMHEGIARGLKVTNGLLAFGARRRPRPGAMLINALIAELKTFLSYGAGPGIKVALELSPDLPRCLVDPRQVSAAIFNLVVNARDAMPEGGVIRISTKLARCAPDDGRAYVRLRVSDNGAGMAPDVLNRIFDPFFTTKGDGGTGLGLPQVQALMRQIGGQIRVRSKAGKGSTFDLFFPVEKNPPVAPENWVELDQWADEGGAIPAAIAGGRG